MAGRTLEPMLEMYLFESSQLLEQLEEILLRSEKTSRMSEDDINETFRIMHTIKGSSSMMMFSNLANLAHHIEDLFFHIRENKPASLDYSMVCDLVLIALDFFRNENLRIESGEDSDTPEGALVDRIASYLQQITGRAAGDDTATALYSQHPPRDQKFYVRQEKQELVQINWFRGFIQFDEGCEMENVRAFTVVHGIKEQCEQMYHYPEDLFENQECSQFIAQEGFLMAFSTRLTKEQVEAQLQEALFVKSILLNDLDETGFTEAVKELERRSKPVEEAGVDSGNSSFVSEQENTEMETIQDTVKSLKQSMITVNINKLDRLMDLVGEIVITESMVIRNPDLAGLQLDNFSKSARQLRKLTDDLQDVVMSIRMLPIGPTFHKMQRIVRDMARKINKEVDLKILGEETEVDKNIIDHLGDPLMHLIRNAMDHGIEEPEDRKSKGKPTKGNITLEASNTGGDVLIRIMDDGRGLDRKKLIEKARLKGLITKNDDEISDEEAYNLILLPGFSTKDAVTEFSGRGVGMDVVKSNIEKVGGSISIDSSLGAGTTINIKIPLTLAIVDGMQVNTGKSLYTIPTVAIRESFKAVEKNLIKDTDDNEMIMIRGNCYPIVRLHRHFGVTPKTDSLLEGIMIMVENDGKAVCLFADELLGEQQVVVKPLPGYLVRYPVKTSGIGGCTILGDGSISLIIDVTGIIYRTIQGGSV
ncbi:chemotaxis protein CheA [Anoxynatronum buryatiense]|uniref:Chemotaxis protein CheA n=1 Tax=Anoxynatronum buryatiense TaxID=489973 RepID=A0AA46AHV8_9CLOT|nr:chemotaxis protein CheA [Anoxynatronum buryatiense]SMP43402.1 two-component system, chemotaxis family, sensor kinase CheA [Anoxynatronum buryatiense]